MASVFIARGFVMGFLWDYTYGFYPSRPVVGDTKEELLVKANKMLEDKSLDSGMGFQRLKGAYLTIEHNETILHDGREFSNSQFEDVFIGNLTDDEKDSFNEFSMTE